MKFFSSNLTHLREKKGITQREAAKQLGYKGPSTLNNYERGVSTPSLADTIKLAEFYDVVISDLLDHDFKLGEPTDQVSEDSPGYQKIDKNDPFLTLLIESYEHRIESQKELIATLSTTNAKLSTDIEKLSSMLKANYVKVKTPPPAITKEPKR